MIDFQSALKAVQNLIAQQEFVSIRVLFASKFGPPQTKEWAEHSRAPPVTLLLFIFA